MKTESKIAYAITAVFILLIVRLGQLQLFQGDELRRLSEENRLRIVKVPAPRGIIFDRNGIPLAENMPYYCLGLQPEMLNVANLDAISSFLGISREEIQKKISGRSALEGIRLKEGLTFKEVAHIEARLSDYPGLAIEVDQARKYLYGEVAAHVIGYLGKLGPEQAKRPGLKDVPRHAFIGQWGIEGLYDDTLRGTAGEKAIEVDALGRELRLISEKEPVKGKDLYLSIDIDLQKEAEKAFGEGAGALVALKPQTGEILALVSKPSFDPNLFAKGISYENWVMLHEDANFPLLNRAVQSHYPPGSIFKIVTSVAGLETHAITPETKVTCGGGLSVGSWTFGCWRKGGHGTLSFHNAFVQSCDVYFYTAGRRAEVDAIAHYARELGLGSPSGLKLAAEKAGFIPDTRWKREVKKQDWYLGETYNTAIGQGYVLLTPLQAARMISAVTNGGYMYDLTLLKIESPAGEGGRPARKIKISDETIALVKDGLIGVVNESGGTGHAARSSLAVVGGKTGTAQVRSLKPGRSDTGKFGDHAWFVAAAPMENPQVAMAVLVEHGGHGGGAAAPIAKRAIEAYLAKDLGADEKKEAPKGEPKGEKKKP